MVSEILPDQRRNFWAVFLLTTSISYVRRVKCIQKDKGPLLYVLLFSLCRWEMIRVFWILHSAWWITRVNQNISYHDLIDDQLGNFLLLSRIATSLYIYMYVFVRHIDSMICFYNRRIFLFFTFQQSHFFRLFFLLFCTSMYETIC